MSADVSLVLVAYRSSAVGADAVASFRREAARLGVTPEVVIVDHSEDPEEAACLRSLEPEKLLTLPNRGYAAGVNAGIAASTGAIVVVGNPDICLASGALEALLDALASGWGIVGPQFELAGLLLPPADVQTPREEVRRWLASRSRSFWARYFRDEVRRWRRVWEASGPIAVPGLSGALLAFRREVAEKVGLWDEGYFLYFEETDWLRRAASAGLRIAQVPGARVEHRWGHAADPAAMSGHLLRSRSRFLRAHFGLRGRMVAGMKLTRTPLRPQPLAEGDASLPAGELLWLLSPTSLGFPAAGFAGTTASFLRALEGFYNALGRPARYLLLAVEPATGGLLGPWSWERSHG
jgi:GT2 family glycosyltransferase